MGALPSFFHHRLSQDPEDAGLSPSIWLSNQLLQDKVYEGSRTAL